LNANLTVGFLLNVTFISFKIMSRPEVRAAFQELRDEHLPPEN